MSGDLPRKYNTGIITVTDKLGYNGMQFRLIVINDIFEF